MENSRILAVADTVGGICGRFCGEGGESYCNTCGNNASVTGNDYVGGIVGLMSGAQMHVGKNQGEVRSLIDFEYNSGYYAGGIAGAVVGESSLFDCDNSGTVAADSSYVGGIAGALMGESNLFLCINHGDVSGFNQVGGLAGLILKDAWFEVSSNNGLVRGIAQVGGLVGYLKSSTGNRCRKSNNYADTIHFSAMGGGVCGYAEDTTMLEGCSSVMILPYDTIIRIQNGDDLRLIRDNVNNGSNNYEGIVIMLDWDLNLGNGWDPIGTPEHPFRGTFDGQDHTINFGIYNESNDYQGFFGYMQGTVKNVNFTQCSVIGRNYVGVIAGYCHGTISNCYSYREKVEGEKYVGGLVGMASYSEIQDCFNGNNIVGEQYVGGIVGDFASCKNDNCYGTMKYDLHGGNVSRCYNYGMVRATGDTSHVGGIAGFTSAEVKHCYNSGIVDGKDFVGGLCGQLDGDNLHHCYNAGHVSATGNNKGAVCGSLDLQNIMYNCFYDRQMCTVQDNNASGYNTLKMTGTALQNVFGTDYWSYHDNEYPTLKTTKKDSTYFRISVKPLLLPGNMPVDKIVQPFCGVTGNAPYSQVEWSRYGTATETVGTIHLADKDSITLLGCGVDTLKVSHPSYGFERLVPIVVAAKEATVETVHTCGNRYTWHGQPYNETGFYTYGNNCDNKQALDLTITPVTITSTLINSTCETIPDGAVLVSVIGGYGNGFRYTWYNDNSNDSIGNTPALTDIPAGSYSVTVTDSLYSTCSQTSPITLTAVAPVALTIKSCDASKTYDGTALTGNRYVVTEEGFEPDTLPADSFAILANGDTLRVTFGNGLINVDTLENGAEFTYSISNGIDHSCHYNVDTIFGTLSITPRPATIIVNDTSKTYGDEDPVFSGTVKGLVNSDSLVIHYFRSSNIETVGNHPDILTAELNENYTVTIDSGDLTISCRDLLNKIDTANWPDDIENWNECYSPSNTNALPSIDSIKKLIIKQLILANNDTLQPDAFQVLTKDSTILANNCDWKWVRTYTVKISNPNFCDSTSRVIYVSGGDQTAPVHSNNYLWIDGTVYQDACLASFDIDLFFPKDQDLFDDCSQMTITHKDTNTGDDHYGWTIRRSYVVTDACGHTIYDTIEVSGRDQTPPVASNPEVKNNTLWADSAQCLCDSIRTIHDIEELTTIFGISDACSGEDVRLVSSSKTLKTGEHLDYTVIIAYVVADAYGNSTTIYHAQFIQDTIGPTFEIVPHDTTLCVDPDGNYENTVTRVADEITITNLHDNCTRLQGSFSVQSSMDTSRFNFYHPRGYRITQGESDNGVRHYKQLWTVTDSCGNTTYDSISIHVRPLPKITQITNPDQHIIYGDAITDVCIYHQYSDLSITGLSGIGLDSLGCSVEHKKDQNNNEYDRVYGNPEFAVNATFLVTATSHQGWGCSSVDSTFSINVERRPIVITATAATKKYDGTPLTSTDYTCATNEGSLDDALVHEDVISRLSFSGSQTNVGSCENTPDNAKITAPNDTTIDKTSSYWIDYKKGTLTVTNNDTLIKVIPGSASKVYDGLPLTKNEHDDFTVTGVPECLTWTATADGKVTNVTPGEGEKAVNAVTSFHIFDADNHDVTAYFTNIDKDSTGTLTILPKEVTLATGGKTREYNGLALTNAEVEGKNANGLTVETGWVGEEGATYTFTGSQTIVGKCVNAFSYTLKENTTASNYHIVKTEDTLEITANTTPIVITSADSSWMYDGNTHTKPEYTVKYGGEDIDTLPGSNGLQFELPIGDTLTVTPTCGGVTTFSDNSANNNIFEFTIQHQDQYADIIANFGTLVITHNTTPITVVPAGGTKPYDGTPLTKTAQTDFTVTGVPEGFTWTATANGTVTNVNPRDGEKTVNEVSEFKIFRGAADVTEHFSQIDKSATGTLSITPKTVTIATGSKTREYNGLALTNDEVEGRNANGLTVETGWVGEEGATYSFTGSQMTIGKSVNTFSYVLKENTTATNYNIVKTEDTLEITANTTAIKVVPAGGSKTYDGTALTKTAHDDFTVMGVPEGFTWTATADGTVTNVHPGAGEKPVNAVTDFQILTAAGDTVTNQFSNIDTSATDTLIISPVQLTVKADAKTKVYGDAEPALTATVTGVIEGENFTPIYTIGRELGDNVGPYIITPAGAAAQGNYTVKYDTALFTITPKAVSITVNDTAKTYGESDPAFTGTVSGLLNDNDLGTVSFVRTNTDQAVGIYENVLSATFTANNNYNVTIDSGNFTINCRNVTMKPDSVWPEDLTGQNNCFANADTTGLKDAQEIQKLFEHSEDVTVAITDIATKTDDCDWKWKRVYTITVTSGCAPVTDSMCVSGSDQTAPVLTGTWPANISGINSCIDDTLQNKLYTNAQVKALFSDCGEFTVDSTVTTTGNNCDWTVTKTYTVKDACGNIYYTSDTTLPSMSVSGSDQTAPMLTGTWPGNISNVNSCLNDTLQNMLYTNTQVKALFSDCGEFSVDSVVTTSGNNCNWTVTKTYTVKDECGNIYYTSGNTLPTMSVSGSDQTAPVLTGLWPSNISNVNSCIADSLEFKLYTNEQVKALFSDCGEFTVDSSVTTTGDNCFWTVTKTYTVKDACGNIYHTSGNTLPTMSVSGSDQTMPALTGTWPGIIENVNSCIADSLEFMLYTNEQVKALFHDFENITVDSTVTTTGDNCSWTVTKTYTVKDSCGNVYYTSDNTLPTMSVSGSDQTAPVLTGTWPANLNHVNSCLVDTLQNLLYTNAQVKALFSECGALTVDSSLTTTGNHCAWTVTKTYTVKDACGNIYYTSGTTLPSMSVSGSDQTAPVLTGSWPVNISNVNSCIADTLQNKLYTNAQVKALFSDCGNILVDSTVTLTGSNCSWTVTKTYTVKDECGNIYYTSGNTLPTMSVSGSDQTAPVLTGLWPSNISNVNSCIADSLEFKLYTNAQVKALFSDCGNILVDSTVTLTGSNCSWTVTKTYTVKDECGNIYYTSGNTLPTMSVSGSDQTAPMLTGTWPGNISNVNSCLNDTLQNMLYTNDQVKALFSDCGEFTVDSSVTTTGDNCFWTVTKTYTVKDACGNIYHTSGTTLPTMSVSGSDQTMPALTGNWPGNIENVNSCIADSLEFMLYTNEQVKALFHDFENITVDSTVTTTGNNCAWTVTKTYTVKDSCGNVYYTSDNTLPTMSVSGSDQTAPVLTGSWPVNISNVNSCIADTLQNKLYTNVQVKALFSDCGNILVDSTVTLTGSNCSWTVTKTYTVKDECGNIYYTSGNTLPTMSVSGSDQTAPVLTGLWPSNISNVNSCIADSLEFKLYTNAQVKALFSDCGEFTVDSSVTTTGDNCFWTVTKTYTVKDACGNIYHTSGNTLPTMSVSGSDQTMPALTGTWPGNIENVNSCIADSLEFMLYTNEQVKALFHDFENITVDSTVTTTGDNCSWTVTKTYMVKDSCGYVYYTSDNTLPTMSISGSDQTAPVLTGLWPVNISNVDSRIDDTLQNKLYTNAQVKALFSDCGEFTVDSTVTTTGDDCAWTVTKTYKVKDACGNIYYTSGTTLPTMSVSGNDQSAPVLTGTWPDNITNQDNCLANADISVLKDGAYIRSLYEDCSGIITVTFDDDTTGNDCAWTITRTYTVTNGYNHTTTPAPTMSVSGGDHTAPVLTGNWPNNNTSQHNCLLNADLSGLKDESYIQALYEDCSGIVTVTFDDDTTGDDCAWSITRTYTVMDGCQNALVTAPTMSVSGGDYSKPSFTVPAAKALCPAEDGTFDISPDITGMVQDATDDCSATEQLTISYTDGEISTLSDGKRRFIRTWTVSDFCGNDSVQTQTITINPLVELSVAPTTQLIALYDTITYVNVTNAYSSLNTPIVTLNNVPITLTAAGLEFQIFAQGAKLSGTPTDTGTYRILFKAISDQEPSCNSKEQEISIIVREVQDTVTVTSNSANKFYDGTPLSSHQYVVTLGHDTIPADEGSNGLIFTLHFNDKLVITPDEESEITDAGSIDNVFSCTLDHAEHYKGLVLKYGTLTVQKKTLSMWLDTSAVYTGHPFVVTYDQIHFSGLAEDDTVNAGTITTLGYAPGNYVCTSGNFYAMMEDGIAVPSGFVITNGLGNYAPAFDITLRIDGITEGFDCPEDLHIVLREGIPDTMLVLTDSATLTPMVDRIVISNDLESQNPLSAGTHTITWTLSDDLGHAMTTCEQTVIVEYTPCSGVEYQGHNYEAERIGHQCWMKENLRNTLNSNDEEIATYHLYKDNDENLDKFGYLYSWYSAMGIPEGDDATPLTYSIGTNGQPYVQGICPNGWAVASMEDFTTLFATVGDASLLKDAGEGYWLSDHGGVTPNSGFNARANGHYNSATQRYEDILTGCYFWIPEGNTSTGNVNSAVLQYYCSDGLFQQHPKSELQGVRCIRKVAP